MPHANSTLEMGILLKDIIDFPEKYINTLSDVCNKYNENLDKFLDQV